MMKDKSLAFLLLVSLCAVTVYGLLTIKENLHCTQYTSLQIALLDMEVHIEEGFDSTPLIYEKPYAIPLRIYFGANLLIFLLFPTVISGFAVLGKVNIKKYLGAMAWVTVIFAANTALAYFLAGERFFFLNAIALFWGIILYSACAWFTCKAAMLSN
jgi:hypothetical protein